MQNIGEYTGDTDDILARHEPRYDRRGQEITEEIIPINYPEWSDSEWKGEWHRYRKYLKEVQRKDIQKKESEIAMAILRQQIVMNVASVIQLSADKKDKIQQAARLEEKNSMDNFALGKSGNIKAAFAKLQGIGIELYDCEDYYLAFLYNILIYKGKKANKKQKKYIQELIDLFLPIVIHKNIPTDPQGLGIYISQIPQNKISEYSNALSGTGFKGLV